MAEITLKAETGRSTGSGPAKRLRAEGKVPAVVYGHGTEPTPVTVDWHDLRAALTTDAGLNALINLDINGTKSLSIVKDMQRHPIRGTVAHIDFILINRDEALEVEVPIILEGEAVKVGQHQGMVDHLLFHITVKAKPGNIPNELTLDISDLDVGDSLRVSDLSLPAGVTTDVDPEETIVTATLTRAGIDDLEAGGGGAEGEGGESGESAGDADADGEADGGDAAGESDGGDEA